MVLQGGGAPLAGAGGPPLRRDLEEGPQDAALPLSAAAQLRLHLTRSTPCEVTRDHATHQRSDCKTKIAPVSVFSERIRLLLPLHCFTGSLPCNSSLLEYHCFVRSLNVLNIHQW